MTKLIVFLLVSILIIGTSIIKKSTKEIDNEQSNIKNLIKNSDDEIISNTDESTSIESSILKKIK